MRTLYATLILFTILLALTGTLAAASPGVTLSTAYGPTIPPDPWTKICYGPTIPPDPWSQIHYGPTIPPDPWSR